MRLLIIPNARAIPVANDHYGGDGKRAPRHGLYNLYKPSTEGFSVHPAQSPYIIPLDA